MNYKTIALAACLCTLNGAFAQRLVNQEPTAEQAKIFHLDGNVNSISSDMAAVRYGDRIYFTSARQQPGDEVPTSRIYSFAEGQKATLAEDLNAKRNAQNVAHVAFMPDASRMYFTICKDGDQGKCNIWYRERSFEGGWGSPKRLPDYINQHSATTTMPAVGWDEEQKKFVLFFVTDRQGGMGGLDVWCSAITWDGQYETPYPLPVNTSGDDVTPYFHRLTQTLYFSSNGRKGQGNFDVFQARKIADQWNKPETMGKPFNSAYDDLYFVLHDGTSTAYLTSDRPGSQCSGAGGNGCYDIYQVVLPSVELTPRSEGLPALTADRAKQM